MKIKLAIAIVITVVISAAYVLLRLSPATPAPNSAWNIDFGQFKTVITTVAGGLLVAVLIYLLPERWKRIESEIQNLRTAQDKALDELRKRADDRISEKLESATREARSLRDNVSGLVERYPWIKGLADADFTPDSCSCQIVLRNAIKFATRNQLALAHEYVFSWTREREGRPNLEGSAFDFIQLSQFCVQMLGDEYLYHLVLSVGYSEVSRRHILTSCYLRSLVRMGSVDSARAMAGQVKEVAFPSWSRRVIRRFERLSTRNTPNPMLDDYAALGVFAAFWGDAELSRRSLSAAKGIAYSKREEVTVILNSAEAAALFGRIDEAKALVSPLNAETIDGCGLWLEYIWCLRRCGDWISAEEALQNWSLQATQVFVESQLTGDVATSNVSNTPVAKIVARRVSVSRAVPDAGIAVRPRESTSQSADGPKL